MTVVYGTWVLRELHVLIHPANPTFLVPSLKFLSLRRVFKEFGTLALDQLTKILGNAITSTIVGWVMAIN